MDTDEILKELTPAQRTELHAFLATFAGNLPVDHKKTSDKPQETSTAVHLKGNVYLKVTMSLYPGDKGTLHPVIENIHQFASREEYLAGIK